MGQTTFANSRGIAHKGSGGMSIAFPDVCKTPAPPAPFVPIPYPNIGKASDTSKGPKKVKTDGKMPMTKGAKYSRSMDDLPRSLVLSRLQTKISELSNNDLSLVNDFVDNLKAKARTQRVQIAQEQAQRNRDLTIKAAKQYRARLVTALNHCS